MTVRRASSRAAEDGWERHADEWRDPAQIASQWSEAAETDPELLRSRVRGPFFELLEQAGITLLVTREYEHLVMALSAAPRPDISFMRMPHPSGIAVDRDRSTVHLGSTRNPNQIYELRPVDHALGRADVKPLVTERRPLVPVSSRFYPGALYLHDLALIDGVLHGNAVGENAIGRFDADGYERVWWPRSIERDGTPDFTRNYLQLNSIAAGPTLESSVFTASAERIGRRRPGHRDFPVDGRGVVFDAATREPVAGGLTRPHSARFDGDRLWVDNSGYGELGIVRDGGFEAVARLPGWTRGLCFVGDMAFVGVSRVIRRFASYAPGLDLERSVCGVFAVDTGSGEIIASISWPAGNQVFAVDWLPRSASHGFPFHARRARSQRADESAKRLFYAFQVTNTEKQT